MHVVSCACPSPRMAAYQHQTELFCITAKGALDFRCGSDLLCRKRATSGREQSQQGSLIRSPRRPAPAALSDTVRSSGFAVLRLIASSNLLGRWSLVLIDRVWARAAAWPLSACPYSRAYALASGGLRVDGLPW